jgi:glycolate dehydrogenase iron-sulfur subunit
MSDMRRLAQLMAELDDQLVVCMRCGMCQAVCPLYAETGRESDVARGKLALLNGLLGQMFTNPRGVRDRLNKCLLCGSCAAQCPSGVKVLEIFLKARVILAAYMGLPPVKQRLFHELLADPARFDRLSRWGARLQGLFLKPADPFLGSSCARLQSPLVERHVKALASISFRSRVRTLNVARHSGIKVGFFVGCLLDKIFPEVGAAVLRCLEYHEVGVFLPEEQGCCGIPALAAGDLTAFVNLVRHQLEAFGKEPIDVLITACATCTATITKIWPMMSHVFGPRLHDQVRDLAAKTMDISAFLVDRVGVPSVDTAPSARTVTYHDPCHLKKTLGVAAQPRALLRADGTSRLVEMAEADRCCGCGGSFSLHHYDIAAAIGRRKRDHIVNSGCQVVATGCPACMLHITDMLSQAGDAIQVRHVVEVYADSLGSVEGGSTLSS